MQKRKLGWSDVEVPVITLGTMNWGQQNTENDAHEQLDYAVDERGLYFLDTAEVYPIPPGKERQGLTETYIGNWINKRGKRDDLVIATKVAPAADIISSRECDGRLDRKNIKAAIEGSLQRLQTDYVDLYQVHWPERPANYFGVRGYSGQESIDATPIEETLEALGELIKDGKVKHIGVSNETPWGVMQYLNLSKEKGLPRIMSIQNQYSLLNRTFEIGLSEMILRENVSLLVYSALSFGVLTGKYLDGAKPKGARFSTTDRNSSRYNPQDPHLQSVIRKYVEIAKDNDLDPAQMAIAFARQQAFATSVIIGARTMEQLKTDIDAHNLTLSNEVLDAIDEVHRQYPDIHA